MEANFDTSFVKWWQAFAIVAHKLRDNTFAAEVARLKLALTDSELAIIAEVA